MTGDRPVTAADEQRKDPTGEHWSESHRLVALDPTSGIRVAAELGIVHTPVRDAGTFHCAVLRPGAAPIVIAELEIEAPDRLWEFRSSGLWVEAVCEDPNRHWSYGLEAFGLAIDDQDELLGRGYGDRVPLGWELEFESGADPIRDGPGPSASPAGVGGGCYRQVGELHGDLLFAAGETVAVEGPAIRRHRWGDADEALLIDSLVEPTAIAGPPATGAEEVAATLPTADGGWWQVRTGAGSLVVVSGPAGLRAHSSQES